MKNLTLLKQEALGILKQLEFGCAQFELGGGGKESESAKGVEIPVNNIELTPLLQKPGRLYAVERFLQSNGLNFSTSFDLIKRPCKFPDGTITENTVFGIIKGENIQDIKTKIEELIHKLNPKEPASVGGNILVKNRKRTTLPKFPRTEWSKVSIKFIDDINFLLSDSRETKPCIPQSLGFIDERDQRPDDAWEFLMKVAKGNGTTDPIGKKEREKQKKHKQRVTDILRTIFENDTDPFEKEKGGVYKAKFSIGYIEDNTPKKKEKREFLDLEEVRKEITGE